MKTNSFFKGANNKMIVVCFALLFSSYVSFAQGADNNSDIIKHVTTLASDEYEGRFPNTKGDALSIAYIIDELKTYSGVTLWRNDGRQRFNFALKESHSTSDNSTLLSGNKEFVWNEHYYPTVYSSSGGVTAPVVFAGYGINAYGEKSRDDYKGIDVNGKWALILRETTAGRLDYTDHCTDYAKVAEAVKRGAAGVLLVHGVRDRWQLLESTDLWQPQCDVPVVCITREAANEMLRGTGNTIEELENKWVDEPQGVVVESKSLVTANFQINRVMTPTNNIIAIVEGSDPKLKEEIVIICAHYDHYGNVVYKGKVGEPTFSPQIFNGANDNATGCAALLRMAKRYGAMQKKMKRSIAFVFLGAEERGLVGAKYLAQNLDDLEPYGEAKLAINFDMIGTLPAAKDSVMVFGLKTFKEGVEILEECEKKSDLKLRKRMAMGITSDHVSFNQHGAIPVLGFHTADPERIHTPFDDIEYIDFEGMGKIIDLADKMVDKLVLKPQTITFDSEVY